MAQLAIKGHARRGSEVIEILEILGGSNAFGNIGYNPRAIYYIDENYENFIICSEAKKVCDYIIFTLEEFLEKYPYKVGGKVKCWINGYCSINTVKDIQWDGVVNEIKYKIQDYWYSTMNLQPYKEETMETITIDDFKANTKEWLIDKLHGMIISDAIKTIGNIHDELHKPKYPKTYEECCKIKGTNSKYSIPYACCENDYSGQLIRSLNNFRKLLICRDAYWKIAGEQMGLGKPWEQNYCDRCFIIANNKGDIHTYEYHGDNNVIFAFPTEEMRDAFYENFKELIETCKELL